MWLEMSRDEAHGGTGWGFTECLWSPTHKNPSGSWPFWDSLARVKEGDVVFHLLGRSPDAEVVGYSTAASDGHKTVDRPPSPGQWGYATSFYRVRLTDYVRLADPIRLQSIFSERDSQLREYFAQNKKKTKTERERLFFVPQAGRLQCLNGAYLSELSSLLAEIALGLATQPKTNLAPLAALSVKTGEQLAVVSRRLGQSDFSENIRKNYGNRCCFPGCSIIDATLLVGAHIARWADADHLRGDTANGLCLCLLHDKAFETGAFTLTFDLKVAISPAGTRTLAWAVDNISPFDGQGIVLGSVTPSIECLREHWRRIGFTPSAS